MVTTHGPFDAPRRVGPESDDITLSNPWFVIQSPDSTGAVIAQYETTTEVKIPASAGSFVVVELTSQSKLANYSYSASSGYQSP